MIRAHMASFPPRKDLMLKNIGNILTQVDRLYLTLNEFERIPDALLGNDKIVAEIPPFDLKDVGKFYFQPAADDFVFTLDDDLVYPEDYVAKMMAHAEYMNFDYTLIGLHGLSVDSTQQSGFKYYHFRKGIKAIRGVSRLGTGVALMKGCCYPPLDEMRCAEGFVDVRFAQWQIDNGNIMWTVPRTRGWVKGNAPEELHVHSLTSRYLANPPKQLVKEHWALTRSKAANDGLRYYEWKRMRAEQNLPI